MNTAPPICSRSHLVKQLHIATELEHSLCCQYLYAVFSLRRFAADFAGHHDHERVELMMNATGRWASDIFAVARQEMEHLAIATNMLTAINERPHLEHRDYPDHSLEQALGTCMVLERCNLDTLRRFQFIERPKGLDGLPPPQVETIYLEIQSLFQCLPASELFAGDGLRQVDESDVTLGVAMKILPVSSRAAAVKAVALILEQGEGLGELATATDSHFARFTATVQDHEQVVSSLKIEPSLPVVCNPVSRRAADASVPAGATLITNEFSAALMDLFNEGYRLMLTMLQQFLWGFRGFSGPFDAIEALQTPHQIAAQRLVTILGENAYFPFMTMFIRPVGELLARQPAFADVSDPARAGAPFQTGDTIPAWTDVRPYVDALHALAAETERLARHAPDRTVANQIVGDGINRIAPPIVPFDLQIGLNGRAYLRRSDPLDPSQPELEIWQLAPEEFSHRVPVTYRHLSDEVVETIFPPAQFTSDPNTTFNNNFNLRRLTLERWLSDPNVDSLTAAGYRTRIRMIDAHPSTSVSNPGLIENRLGLQRIWDHPTRGNDAFVSDELAPFVGVKNDWHTRFWMGGWDGDLLVGWTSGYVDLPLLG